jgi:osmotically inducible lipoprotein OsmB
MIVSSICLFDWMKENRAMLRMILIVAGIAVSVASCGSSRLDRGLSGGAIGAGAGAATGAATGGSATTGAILGGAAGAATGVLTDEDDINLGRPIWRR